MAKKNGRRLALVAMFFVAFILGHVSGSLRTPRASAQLPQIPGGLPGGGALGAATQLASSITDMEQHVSGLQKNLDTLRKIQSVLGGK
jgi:hypothetical protein